MASRCGTRVAYIANEFPNLVEGYIVKEVEALRQVGTEVFCYSVKIPKPRDLPPSFQSYHIETVYLRPLKPLLLIKAAWFALRSVQGLKDIYHRILFRGHESAIQRLKALSHLLQGVYFALLIRSWDLSHIHAHHGYSASFAAMVASRMLGIPYSLTLHGSDLLINRFYLDLKLKHCKLCFTISDYNKRFLLEKYKAVSPNKVIVRRMGTSANRAFQASAEDAVVRHGSIILSVGRLHKVKNHDFLIRACAKLKERRFDFICIIIGGGDERQKLENMIEKFGLVREVKLLDSVDRPFVDVFYEMADLVVLTSKSEGIPIVLMEAMLRKRIVLAPEITGIPELVLDGKTGFLYRAGDLEDFVSKAIGITEIQKDLADLRERARNHVLNKFDESKNLESFVSKFLEQMKTT
jgi:colanic acid/amylovoran biosynthesis glycosyltransferase